MSSIPRHQWLTFLVSYILSFFYQFQNFFLLRISFFFLVFYYAFMLLLSLCLTWKKSKVKKCYFFELTCSNECVIERLSFWWQVLFTFADLLGVRILKRFWLAGGAFFNFSKPMNKNCLNDLRTTIRAAWVYTGIHLFIYCSHYLFYQKYFSSIEFYAFIFHAYNRRLARRRLELLTMSRSDTHKKGMCTGNTCILLPRGDARCH
jgi:hypothetical protein